MEDFEKGLMLAGYIMPATASELHERELLAEYEQQQKKPKNIYFKRVVLAAEIAAKLYNEPTLGRVKFQKLVYLCEHVANMDLANRYVKQAAGPFDNKFMHTIDKEFKTQKWFLVEKITERSITRSKYVPLENLEKYKQYYDRYFGPQNEQIQMIIELFRSKRTDYTELAATVFACYQELVQNGTPIAKDNLLQLFYDWSEHKKVFSEAQVVESFIWLQENRLISNTVSL